MSAAHAISRHRPTLRNPLISTRLSFIWILPLFLGSHSVSEGAQGAPVTVRILVSSSVPDPAQAPYADCLQHFKVEILRGTGTLLPGTKLVAIAWAFKDRKLAADSDFRAGDEFELHLIPFADVDAQYGQIMRVDDTGDFQSPLYWVEAAKRLKRTSRAPSPTPSPQRSPDLPDDLPPGGSATVRKILGLIKSHAPNEFGLGGEQFKFFLVDYNYLIHAEAWRHPYRAGEVLAPSPLESIVAFRDQLSKFGIELLVVFPPGVAAVFPDFATEVPWDIRHDGRVDIDFEAFVRELRKQRIEVLDLLEPFVAERFEPGPDGKRYSIYLRNDSHWSPAGARLAARLAGKFVKARPWYGAALRAAPPRKFVETSRIVDVREFIPPDSTAPQPRSEATVCWSATPAAGAAPVSPSEARSAPIQLISDSFGHWGHRLHAAFYDHLSAQTLLPVGMTAVGGSAINAAPRRWAEQADLDKTKVVVWLIPAGMIAYDRPWGKVVLERK